MKPSLRSWSWGLGPLGAACLIFAGFAIYFNFPLIALVAGVVAGTQFKVEKEYHIERSAHIRTLVGLVGTSGPRDEKFQDIAVMANARLNQVARKSQQLPDEILTQVTKETLEFELRLEDIILKEGL